MDWEPAAGIAAIEKMVEKGVELNGLKTPYRQIKVCGGAAGCPLSVIDDKSIATALAGAMDETGLDGYLAGRIEGPALFHHKFRVALAGCPNACSQPQISDFGVIGQSRPGTAGANCAGCGLCVETCPENAITLTNEGPVFDWGRCLNCGRCIQACPEDAIGESSRGYRLLVGGKLGRHPRLADTVLEMADKEQLIAVLKATVKLYMNYGRAGERLGGLVERRGFNWMKAKMLGES